MILIDGEPGESVPASDRGLAYGDGLFETMAVRDGRVLALDAHLERLGRGAARLGLTAPSRAQVLGDLERLALDGTSHAVVKLMVTRGSGGRGYRPPAVATARRITSSHPWPATPARDAPRLGWICRHPLGTQPALAGIKHLNRLDQVLASAEWPDPDHVEGLMLDVAGRLVEGTRSNVFLACDGTLVTPALDHAGIAGVVRGAVLDHAAALGITCEVREVSATELDTADEIFITGSVLGICSLGGLSGAGARRMPAATPLADRLRMALVAARVIA
ncbi:MAG: aminodeoxychorismate lyase [Gammaproteobacteria bacterium]